MGTPGAVDPGETAPEKESGTQTLGQSQGADGDLICAQNRHRLGRPTPRNGLRVGHDLLAALDRRGTGGCVAKVARGVARQTPGQRPNRLVARGGGQCVGPGGFGGEGTGPNPTDRAKAGTKHHVITDAQGIPLAARLTAANASAITHLLPVVEAIPAVRGRRGRPRRRPKQLYADRGYDSDLHRQALRDRSIQPWIARRRRAHGSGLGGYRWVVERTLSWLHQFRRR